ncbi:hypothetical protein EDB83DRAFT_2234511 [Lactarius deliciosus]|nr:hypothetical protein EDB83DRAFT_2234511 [Lactarius deliciosus]
MTDPWPQWLVQSFLSANQPQFAAIDECVYYGPYTHLLYHLFGIEGPFEISPKYHIPQTPLESIDIIALFTVELNKHPVFFIQVEPLGTLSFDWKRRRADDQIRDHFRDLRHFLVTPRLLVITPRAIMPDPDTLNDVAPIERWNCDLFEDEGINHIRRVAQAVKAIMCLALGN